VISDSPVIRAGIRVLMPDRSVTVIGDLEGPGELLNAVVDTDTRLVVAAPVDNGDLLFEAISALPARCATLVLLPVPGFRIQSSVLTSRLDIRCLPLTVDPPSFAPPSRRCSRGRLPYSPSRRSPPHPGAA
jgi:hypothetical protein